nr:MAG TPA: Sec-independent protein translocase protein tatAd protein, PROTEIN TRANSPORT [Caudoviricetes sp.]
MFSGIDISIFVIICLILFCKRKWKQALQSV